MISIYTIFHSPALELQVFGIEDTEGLFHGSFAVSYDQETDVDEMDELELDKLDWVGPITAGYASTAQVTNYEIGHRTGTTTERTQEVLRDALQLAVREIFGITA